MNREQYLRSFGLSSIGDEGDDDPKEIPGASKPRAERALEIALDIRKFEIEMYWKRAAYFWAFIALTLGGYASLITSSIGSFQFKGEMLLALSCLGLVFSVAWFFVNRASKFWQQNWEGHVDLLEDNINGPLYKTVMEEQETKFIRLTSSYPFSVSKLNQLLSLFMVFLFIALIVVAVLVSFSKTLPMCLVELGMITATFFAIAALFRWGQTGKKERIVRPEARTTLIAENPSEMHRSSREH